MNNSNFWLTRLWIQRGLAFIYVIGFLIALNQGPGLIGTRGILPAEQFISNVDFWVAPSIYLWNASGTALIIGNTLGLLLAFLAFSGVSERFGGLVSAGIWFLMWMLYLSLINVGQIFYGYGWEIMLCEAGFLAIFLGSKDMAPPKVVIWMFRWIVFRLMFGAGMIKLRGDDCWRDLTCMIYHYETQPLPNPLSQFFHHLPVWFHKLEVAMTHFIELIVPFGLFVPGMVCRIAGIVTILFQISLIISGNLSWLNYVTIVIAFSCLDDAFLKRLLPWTKKYILVTMPSMSKVRTAVLGGLCLLIGFLSIAPARNLLASGQLMNAGFDPFNLVNTYGAFGSITRTRYEIILEGTNDEMITPDSQWFSYEFRCKPGNVKRRPCIVSPYHYKIDWQMWFAAMNRAELNPWIFPFIQRLLEGEPEVVGLLAHNPFPDSPPKFIRARLMEYHFTKSGESGWWNATPVGEYLKPVFLKDFY